MIIDTCYHTQLLNLPALKESLSLLHSQGPQCCSVLMKNEPQATANSTARWHRPRYHLFYAIRKTRPIWWWCRLAHWPTPESKAQSHHEKLFRRLPPLTICSSSTCMAFLPLLFPHWTLLPPLTSCSPEKELDTTRSKSVPSLSRSDRYTHYSQCSNKTNAHFKKKAINGAVIGHLKDKYDSIKTAFSLD